MRLILLRIAAYSDLHNVLPEPVDCDLAVIAGDICPEAHPFRQLAWLENQFRHWITQFPRAVWIAGNHDYICASSINLIPYFSANHIYLKDEGYNYLFDPFDCSHNNKFRDTLIQHTRIWGSPWSLPYGHYSFMASEEDIACRLMELESIQPTILISHSPPFGHGDIGRGGVRAGSKSLLKAIQIYQPKLVVTGHLHESRGVYEVGKSLIVNAAMAGNSAGRGLEYPPILVEFDENYLLKGFDMG